MFVSFQAIAQGTLLGVFLLGMLFPWANSAGALVGGLTSSILVAWISIGAQMVKNQMKLATKPLLINGCDNTTLTRYYTYLNSSISTIEEQ